MIIATVSMLRRAGVALVALAAGCAMLGPVAPARAEGYHRIGGDGSSWAGNALSQWSTDVKKLGVTVDYNPDGSSQGRANFAHGLSDFAVSEIPYAGEAADLQDTAQPSFGYTMLPLVGGGTSFMYNLPVDGARLTTLKLTQAALAKIFSGQVTQWNDPVIAATNPGVNLPAQRITVVVHSDGAGATAQVTAWMLRQYPSDYAALCGAAGCNPSAATSYFPYQGLANFVALAGSNGVTTYTANTPYTIDYDEYSYALGVGYPVAQVQNAAGFFTTPTATAVAIALTRATIDQDAESPDYLNQDLSAVYAYGDPRTYPISAYAYLMVPTETHDGFTAADGATLAYFGAYSLCQGQRESGALGYSPLPMNLVLAGMDQLARVPGIDAETSAVIAATRAGVSGGDANPCNNPTFKPGDSPAANQLTRTAPFPEDCDAACRSPWVGTAVVDAKPVPTVTIAASGTYGTATAAAVTVRLGEMPAVGSVTVALDGTPLTVAALSGGAVTVWLPATIAAGGHTLTAGFAATPDLAAATGQQRVVIARASTRAKVTVLKPKKVTRTAAAKGRVRARVTVSVPGTRVTASGAVTATVGSRSTIARLRGDGTATLKLPKSTKKRLTVVLTYGGTADLAGTTATTTVKVRH